jgi:hypothetical protein
MNRLIRPRDSKGRFVKIKREAVPTASDKTKPPPPPTNSPAEKKERGINCCRKFRTKRVKTSSGKLKRVD